MAELAKYKKLRAVAKSQITRAYNLIVRDRGTENMTSDEADVRIGSLRSYWVQFNEAQSKIELDTEDDDLEDLISCRGETEDIYLATEAALRYKNKPSTCPTSSTPTSGFTPNVTTNIAFVPFNEEESFTNFIKRFENYLDLKEIIDEKRKLSTLLHTLSPKLHETLQDLVAPDDPYDMEYCCVVNILKEHLEPLPNILSLQHRFVSRIQQNESITHFSLELNRLAKHCEFKCGCGKSVSDMLLRMQFVRGLRDNDIRGQLLQKKELSTFKKAVEFAVALETSRAESNMMGLQSSNPEVLKISKDRDKYKKQSFEQDPKHTLQKSEPITARPNLGNSPPYRSKFASLQGRCFRCGDRFHKANVCRFKNEFCHTCKKVGHLAKVCMGSPREKPVGQLGDKEDRDELDYVTYDTNKVHVGNSDKYLIDIKIENRSLTMELDTGAALTSISYKDYTNLKLEKKMFKTNIQLRTYTGEIIKPRGVVYVRFEYKNNSYFGKLYVINQNVEPIFGREWLREVNLDICEIKTLEENSCQLDEILREFSDLFEKGIGCIPDELGHLHLKEGQNPIFIKPRQVPYSIKEKVENELNRLEEVGIITKVNNSEWGTPIVPVIKPNGSVRICADYKSTINKVIQDEKYPIPRIEDIFAEMNGAHFFCTLDISNAYLHMPMDQESAVMQTISTQKGLYKVNRLMFGVKVAPAIWQRYMDKILQGLSGVKCFFDDLIIQGSNYQETLERLKSVLLQLRKSNLKLNFEKCKFFQKKIDYLGHVIDENGLHKNGDKVKAILDAPRPKDLNQLRSFLGLSNYYNKFIPKLAEKLSPLNKLLCKGQKFVWTKECEKSFKSVKEDIANDRTLIHYDPNLPLILSTDASPTGLGAVISHRTQDGVERPIAFASRSLTKSETHYSQIDKEATAIYWGVRKFFTYLYGRKFILITDHKPLVSIFHPSKSLPAMSASRLLNYSLFLAGFDYTIEYRNTLEHSNADFLSRFPVEKSQDMDDIHSKFQINQIAVLPLTKTTLAEHTRRDQTLAPLVTALKNGDDIEVLGFHNNELTLEHGCIFRGSRVVIPNTLQSELLKELHIGHMGITKMKALARSYLYWKNMDSDIENLVKSCQKCNQKRKTPQKVNPHPWEEPTAPWHRIHIDFFGPTNGNYFFVVVDAFSKWLEVIPTKNTTSEWCIRQLKHLFAIFGLPLTVVSDNGGQFVSSIFQRFLEEYGICHRTCAPFHPSSNGQAERFVQTVKQALTAMSDEQGDLTSKLDRLLVQLRKVPNSTGTSAYKLMFGRDVRTRLNVLADRGEVGNTSGGETVRKFNLGQKVQARDYYSREKWKIGNVVSKMGEVMYKIKMDHGPTWTRHADQMIALN